MGLYTNDFSKAFSALLEKGGVTCYQIYQYTGLDQAYLSCLKNGKKNNPSPETVMKIAIALSHFGKGIKLHDIEVLFNSVGRSILSKNSYKMSPTLYV